MPPAELASLLRERAADPHPGLRFEDGCWSWAEVVAEGAARAHLALSRRVPGPFHVGVLLDNVPDYVFWIVAAALSGAAVVGVNSTRRGAELARDLTATDCQLLVTDREHLRLLDGLDTGFDPDRLLLVDSDEYVDRLAPYRASGLPDVSIRGEDRLLLLFTAGSTGSPKPVICSQARLAAIAHTASGLFGITRDTVGYNALPLFHGNAIMANWAPVLAAGGTFAIRRRFSASGFLPDVRRFGATYFNYVGRTLAYILATTERPDDADNPLRLGFGTEASARDRERFAARFGCRLVEGYGSSEGAVRINLVPGTPPGALGRPPDGEDVRILDPRSGEECPPARFDERGRLLNPEAIGEIVGVNLGDRFEGYYNSPEASAARVRGGAFWTGDLGYRDEGGWFYFAGRGEDRLRVDGENFAAGPIEAILHRMPGVVVAAVYPVPDPRTGDAVMAALELEPGVRFDPDAFAAFLAGQADLGTKWAPRFVRIVAAIPRTATNKTRKTGLRAESWHTTDPVFWRPGPRLHYQRMTGRDRHRLDTEYAAHH